MIIQRVDRVHANEAAALLTELRVSLLGAHSVDLHRTLVYDALAGRIDCRIAVDDGGVCGIVVAAPASYWPMLLLRNWRIAAEFARAKLARGGGNGEAPAQHRLLTTFAGGVPPFTWTNPGDAWRIIIVGTAERARGRGIAAALYRALMTERSLAARIACDNAASLRLHESLGWQLFPDGDVVLAVHVNC
jgi:GNAT superfamily N-acetyltransferase